MIDARRWRRLSAPLAIVLMTLLIPTAEAAIVFDGRFGDPIVDPEEDVAGLRDPQDIAVDDEGNIFVVDQHYHRVQKYDPKGRWIMSIGKPSFDGTYTQDGQLQHPQSIAINGNLLYVADTSNSQIQVFVTSSGSFHDRWGEVGVGEGQLNAPGGIDIDNEGNIWVADTRNHRVQKFSATGDFLDSFGSTATEEGELDVPVGIVVADSLGKVFVTDEYPPWSMVEYTTGGAFVAQHGVDELSVPDEITVDETDGIVYVIEAGGSEVSMFDALDGSFIDAFEGTDRRASNYGFSPHGIYFHQDTGFLFVAAGGAEGKKVYRYDAIAVPEIDADAVETDRVAQEERLSFLASHNAMLGECSIKGTGVLKTPTGETFDVRGPLDTVRSKRFLQYEVPVRNNDALRAVRRSRVRVKMTFRSPDGCNDEQEQPEPFTMQFAI